MDPNLFHRALELALAEAEAYERGEHESATRLALERAGLGGGKGGYGRVLDLVVGLGVTNLKDDGIVHNGGDMGTGISAEVISETISGIPGGIPTVGRVPSDLVRIMTASRDPLEGVQRVLCYLEQIGANLWGRGYCSDDTALVGATAEERARAAELVERRRDEVSQILAGDVDEI